MKDFMNHELCVPCWNMHHFDREKNDDGKPVGYRFSECLQGGCECDCTRVLNAEAHEAGKQHLLAKRGASNPFRASDTARRHFYYCGFQGKTFPESEEMAAAGNWQRSATPESAEVKP